jgi:hypothetical protein
MTQTAHEERFAAPLAWFCLNETMVKGVKGIKDQTGSNNGST